MSILSPQKEKSVNHITVILKDNIAKVYLGIVFGISAGISLWYLNNGLYAMTAMISLWGSVTALLDILLHLDLRAHLYHEKLEQERRRKEKKA